MLWKPAINTGLTMTEWALRSALLKQTCFLEEKNFPQQMLCVRANGEKIQYNNASSTMFPRVKCCHNNLSSLGAQESFAVHKDFYCSNSKTVSATNVSRARKRRNRGKQCFRTMFPCLWGPQLCFWVSKVK